MAVGVFGKKEVICRGVQVLNGVGGCGYFGLKACGRRAS